MGNVNVIWTVRVVEYKSEGLQETTRSIDQEVEELHYRYHRLRDEDRPIVIQVFGSGLSDGLVAALQAAGLPAALMPYPFPYPMSLIQQPRRFRFHR